MSKKKYCFKRTEQELKYMLPGLILLFVLLCSISVTYTYDGLQKGINVFSIKEDPIYLLSYVMIIGGVIIIIWFVRNDFRIRKYRKQGKKYIGRIIAANSLYNARVNRIYLIIEFIEDGAKKKLLSQSYANLPNENLKSVNCSIYKYKNKYLECDFDVREKETDPKISIPYFKKKACKRDFVNKKW